MTLAAWLTRALGGRMLAATAGLAALLGLVDLIETTPRILDEGRGPAGVLTYLVLRAPHLLLQAAPLGVLGGALFGFNRLARDGAATALRAAGVSAYRLVGLSAPAAGGAALAVWALGAGLAPAGDQALAGWWRVGRPAATAPEVRTFRLGPDIVSAAPEGAGGDRLSRVDVYRRAPDGRLVMHLTADGAVLGPGGRWRLHGVRWEDYARAPVTTGRAADLPWTDRLDPTDVRALFDRDAAPGPAAARRALRGGAAPLPLSAYRTQLHRIGAAAAGAVVMVLIAAPAALGQVRDGGATRLMLASLAAGLLFLVTDGVMTALAAGGVAPPVLGAWGAPLLFAFGALAALLNLEG